MTDRATEDSPFPVRAFPYWVALGSLTFALLLFFANTVGALREQQSLQDLEVELGDLREQYDGAIRVARIAAGPRDPNRVDLQSVLVAIDRQGYTPYELSLAYPRPENEPDESDQPDGIDGERSNLPESR